MGEDERGTRWRNVPHFNFDGAIQFVTYGLADSDLLRRQRSGQQSAATGLRGGAPVIRARNSLTRREAAYGSCVLRHEISATVVIENFQHHEPEKYRLLAWVVMPTHVHVLLQPTPEYTVGRIVQLWKTYTGHVLSPLYPAALVKNSFWQADYWDRYIRDEAHLATTIRYIRMNPVKAGLVRTPSEWPYLWVSNKDRR